jgi:hypothetical protein
MGIAFASFCILLLILIVAGQSHYQILGIDKNATPREIKRAYKQLALKYHPDRNPNVDPQLFPLISKAYECLKDEKRRNQYDMFGDDDISRGYMDPDTFATEFANLKFNLAVTGGWFLVCCCCLSVCCLWQTYAILSCLCNCVCKKAKTD